MSDPGKSVAERLATQVQYLKGVGPRRAEMLERLGLRTVADLLFFFPRDYEDHTDRRSIADLEEGSLQSVRGLVEEDQELFILQLALAIKRQQQPTLHQAEPLEATARIDASTRGQRRTSDALTTTQTDNH
jgi:RecG-like helicase